MSFRQRQHSGHSLRGVPKPEGNAKIPGKTLTLAHAACKKHSARLADTSQQLQAHLARSAPGLRLKDVKKRASPGIMHDICLGL
jgi:hypothetical protein